MRLSTIVILASALAIALAQYNSNAEPTTASPEKRSEKLSEPVSGILSMLMSLIPSVLKMIMDFFGGGPSKGGKQPNEQLIRQINKTLNISVDDPVFLEAIKQLENNHA